LLPGVNDLAVVTVLVADNELGSAIEYFDVENYVDMRIRSGGRP